MIRVDRAICKLEIWETAGQERFSTITASYFRGAQGAILVYDFSKRDSFEHVQAWYDRAKQLGGEDIEAVLVGNKIDLASRRRKISIHSRGRSIGSVFGHTAGRNNVCRSSIRHHGCQCEEKCRPQGTVRCQIGWYVHRWSSSTGQRRH